MAWIGSPNLLGGGDQDPAARGAVELGHDEAGHARAVAKHLDLRKGVLAGRRVEDEEDVVGRLGVQAAEHPADLRQLLHQMGLVLEPAGGVDDQHVLTRSPSPA